MSFGIYSPYRRYNEYEEAPSYKHGHTHQGEHGNLTRDVLPLDILSNYEVGTKILMDEFVWDHTITNIRIKSERSPGLVIDLGVLDKENGVEHPTLFGAAIATDAVNPGNGYMHTELLSIPFRMHEDLNLGLRYALMVTLAGTVTNGDRIWIEQDRIFIGNN